MEDNLVLQIVMLAFLLEAVIQTLKPLWEPGKRTVEFYISLVVGIVLAVAVNVLAGLDVFAALGIPLVGFPLAGVILTGVLVSRGSGVLHDLLKAASLIKMRMQG